MFCLGFFFWCITRPKLSLARLKNDSMEKKTNKKNIWFPDAPVKGLFSFSVLVFIISEGEGKQQPWGCTMLESTGRKWVTVVGVVNVDSLCEIPAWFFCFFLFFFCFFLNSGPGSDGRVGASARALRRPKVEGSGLESVKYYISTLKPTPTNPARHQIACTLLHTLTLSQRSCTIAPSDDKKKYELASSQRVNLWICGNYCAVFFFVLFSML